jgi:hypothetical protein
MVKNVEIVRLDVIIGIQTLVPLLICVSLWWLCHFVYEKNKRYWLLTWDKMFWITRIILNCWLRSSRQEIVVSHFYYGGINFLHSYAPTWNLNQHILTDMNDDPTTQISSSCYC